jgi:hypothetical protein
MVSRFSRAAITLAAGLLLALAAFAPAAPAAGVGTTAQVPRGTLVFAFHPL